MKKREIILQGKDCDYTFNPSARNAIRQVAKFSHIFKGYNNSGKEVLIKALPKEYNNSGHRVKQFRSEANWHNVHVGLNAPFEYIYQDNTHFLISEYIQNISVRDYIRYRRLFLKKRIRIAVSCGLQLLDAVNEVHKKGYIHGDIKPDNVLFLTNQFKKPDYKQPEFRLIDFGMTHKPTLYSAGSGKTTKIPFSLIYSPPEQVLGFHELEGYHSDLYNIAFLIYEMITKSPIYNSNISLKIINLQTSYPLPDNKKIPEGLMNILKKGASKYHFKRPPNHYTSKEVHNMLSEGISKRYHYASEFKRDLEEFYYEWSGDTI